MEGMSTTYTRFPSHTKLDEFLSWMRRNQRNHTGSALLCWDLVFGVSTICSGQVRSDRDAFSCIISYHISEQEQNRTERNIGRLARETQAERQIPELYQYVFLYIHTRKLMKCRNSLTNIIGFELYLVFCVFSPACLRRYEQDEEEDEEKKGKKEKEQEEAEEAKEEGETTRRRNDYTHPSSAIPTHILPHSIPQIRRLRPPS